MWRKCGRAVTARRNREETCASSSTTVRNSFPFRTCTGCARPRAGSWVRAPGQAGPGPKRNPRPALAVVQGRAPARSSAPTAGAAKSGRETRSERGGSADSSLRRCPSGNFRGHSHASAGAGAPQGCGPALPGLRFHALPAPVVPAELRLARSRLHGRGRALPAQGRGRKRGTSVMTGDGASDCRLVGFPGQPIPGRP